MGTTTGGNNLINVNLILEKAKVRDKLKIADLGCGSSGHFVFTPAKLVGKKGVVYAVDILKPVLDSIERRAKLENFENIITVWTNLEVFNGAKIQSSSLDIALLVNTLFQSKKRVEILREAIRMLKREGRLVIVDWKNIALPFGPPPEERVNIDNLKIAAEKLGLQLEEEFQAGPYHYGLIFIKL
jgi:ubiquinone/menaquinone biosynthesis C-methylase UbiE